LAGRAAALSLRDVPLNLPFTVIHHDPSGLFAVEATVISWRKEPRESLEPARITVTLGTGTLHDADKGPFPLDGLELTVRATPDGVEPIAVRNPGVLSEFQQEALLDAVASGLNARNGRWSTSSESETP
jgi:hypothetical protein